MRMPWPRRVASLCWDILCQCRSDVGETLVTVRRRHRRCRLSPAGPVGALRSGEHPSLHGESACHCARASEIPRVAPHDEPHRTVRVIPANPAPPTHHVTKRPHLKVTAHTPTHVMEPTRMARRASSVVRRTVKRSPYRRRKCEPPMQVTDAAVPAGAPLSRRRRRCDRDLAGAAAPPPTGRGLQRDARGVESLLSLPRGSPRDVHRRPACYSSARFAGRFPEDYASWTIRRRACVR